MVAHADGWTVGQFAFIASHAIPIPRLLALFPPRRAILVSYPAQFSPQPAALPLRLLRTFATVTTRELAPTICVDVGVSLSPQAGYVRGGC